MKCHRSEDQLLRRMNEHHQDADLEETVFEYVCLCDKTFATNSSLKRHKTSCYALNEIFQCVKCHFTFDQKSDLVNHVKTIHRCKKVKNSVSKPFSISSSLIQLVEDVNPTKSCRSLTEKRRKLICAHCEKQFSVRSNLIRHIKVIHPNQNFKNTNFFSNTSEYFECAECHRKVNRKDALVKHIMEQHQNVGLDKCVFECNYCGKKCKRKFDVLRHIHSRHSKSLKQWSAQTDYAKCNVCGLRFPLKVELIKHYEVDHHIQLAYENLTFKSVKDFEKWKTDLRLQAICQFVKQNFWRNATEEITRYRCHRSGFQKIKDTRIRKRFLKVIGSKRLGGHCPAELVVRRKLIDNSCVVRYQKIHVGHEIGTEDEMKHIFIKEEEKTDPIKHYRGTLTSQQRTLRLRHRTARDLLLKTDAITIQPSSNKTWLISSFKGTARAKVEMYLVSRQDTVECESDGNKPCHLMCTLCGICFHQYTCTCPDSNIRKNMCIHIHSLGINLLEANKDLR